MYEVKINISNM